MVSYNIHGLMFFGYNYVSGSGFISLSLAKVTVCMLPDFCLFADFASGP